MGDSLQEGTDEGTRILKRAAAALAIAAAVLRLVYASARAFTARITDRVDPALIERIATLAVSVDGVVGVHTIQAEWAGRALHVVLHVNLPGGVLLAEAHDAGKQVRQRIIGALPQVSQVEVHLDPVDY